MISISVLTNISMIYNSDIILYMQNSLKWHVNFVSLQNV